VPTQPCLHVGLRRSLATVRRNGITQITQRLNLNRTSTTAGGHWWITQNMQLLKLNRTSTILPAATDIFIVSGDDESNCCKTSVRVPSLIRRQPRTAPAVQSPRVNIGETLGHGSFLDHGVTTGRRTSVNAFIIFRTKTTFVSFESGVTESSTRR